MTNQIEERITYHSYIYSKLVVIKLREDNYLDTEYTNISDVRSICSIVEHFLVSSFTQVVKNFIISFEDVKEFIHLYSATPNPKLKKMLSFRQTCRYILYLLPSLNLYSAPSPKSDIDKMDELCRLIALNNLIQQVNQAYGIQSLVDYPCLKITLGGYILIDYTDSFIVGLNNELSSSYNLIHKNFLREDVLPNLISILDKKSPSLKRIFDYHADFFTSPADIYEVTNEALNENDSIVKGLLFDTDNVNLLMAINKPYDSQYRTRFRPLICLNIDGHKRVFTTSWLLHEAMDEICNNLLPYAKLPEEWRNVVELKDLSKKAQESNGVEFEREVESIVKNHYLVKSDISGFNNISLKKAKVPNTNRRVGQIDLIVIDEDRKIIYVIDAKCTKTKFFFQTFQSDKEYFEEYRIKLNDKIDWVRDHKDIVAKYFKLTSLEDYTVEGFFVSNSLIYFGFFSTIPIIPLDKLIQFLKEKDVRALFK